jgi:two-component system response regulator YesN
MRKLIKTVIVDDEVRLRRGIERLVVATDDSFEIVGQYSNGMDCLQAFQEGLEFDLLITDVKMPEIDGLTLINELRQECSFHAIIVSGFDDFQFVQKAIREGASDYIIKPIDREEFKLQLLKVKDHITTQWTNELHYQDIESKASQLTYTMQTQLLSDITLRRDLDLSFYDRLKDFPDGSYYLAHLCMDYVASRFSSFSEYEWSLLSLQLEDALNQLVHLLKQKLIDVWIWKGDERSYWILFHQGEKLNSQNDIYNGLDQLRDKLNKDIRVSCSVALSNEIKELTLLPSIKEELLTYVQFRLIYGGNQIFSSSIIDKWKKSKSKGEFTEIETKIDKIIFTLDNFDKEKTKEEIAPFIKAIEKLTTPEEIERAIQLLGIQTINYVIKHRQGNDELSLINEVLEITKKTSNITGLRIAIYEWLKHVLAILNIKDEHQHVDSIELSKKWIALHLNQNITIQKIANQVHMNPTYFSKYFKGQTGETVLDYVTRLRIEKARELLLSTELKIYDISLEVGYTDTKYFSKLFKKYYGEVPSKYRERNLYKQKKLPFTREVFFI